MAVKARLGLVRRCASWKGVVWSGSQGMVRSRWVSQGAVRLAWRCGAWWPGVRYGRRGSVRFGKAGSGMAVTARRVMVRRGNVRNGWAGEASRGRAR